MARWKTVPDGLSIGASRWPALLKLNEKALEVPGGCNEPEFGPCALVTATLRTDWGAGRRSGEKDRPRKAAEKWQNHSLRGLSPMIAKYLVSEPKLRPPKELRPTTSKAVEVTALPVE
jgi:hypothetical protein